MATIPNPDDVDWNAPRRREHDETWTLDKQIAQARREMGPAKWKLLNAEWPEEWLTKE